MEYHPAVPFGQLRWVIHTTAVLRIRNKLMRQGKSHTPRREMCEKPKSVRLNRRVSLSRMRAN
jgi:hypothetical protein